ncbi:MAG: alpha-rhamnosidase [Pedosphaera sp.]|nr:alpha-rhamnosidase [Pedosphaera sp.]
MKSGFFRNWFLLAPIMSVASSGILHAAVPVVTTNTLPVTGADVVGSQVIFTASFSGATSYQWQKNTGGGPVNIPGATNTTLLLTNLQLSDTASYSLQASNVSGTASSAARAFTVNPVPAPVNGIITSIANQTGMGTNTTFTPTWALATNSLIAGTSPSTVGTGNFALESSGGVGILTDGIFGPIASGLVGTHPSFATGGTGGGTSLTYSLPVSATNGYDLTNIIVHGGWNDSGRDQQGYTISYATAANPNTFIALTTVNYNPTIPASVQSAIRITLASSTAAPLATNVVKLKLDFTTVAVENGYTGYSEVALFGTPSGSFPTARTPTISPASPVYPGTIVTFSELASGQGPLQYQWQSDNGTAGVTYTDIASATASNYVLNTTGFANTTNRYRVKVSNVNGTAISPAVTLITSTMPVANVPTASPASSVFTRTDITLNESAIGVQPIQYQWQSDNGSGGAAYTDISGATGLNYVVSTTSLGNAAINYRVKVTDINGSSTSSAIVLTITDPASPPSTVGNLRCEHLQNPLGLDVLKPRFNWMLNLPQRGAHQTAYQILVASSPAILAQNQGDLWNTGETVNDQSVLVEYAGQPLVSGEACYWKMRFWDQNGIASGWSTNAMWTMGLLNPTDWSAQWISITATNISPAAPSPMLRKTFSVTKPVARATAYICGLAYFELQINGAKIGDHVLDATFSRFDLKADYVTFDVTTNLVQGQNAMGVQLANGLYNGWAQDAWNIYTAPWRALPQMIMQLDIQYTDGTRNLVVSDPSWKAATGPLLLDETRLGEVYDARLEKTNWTTAAYNDSTWAQAIAREGITGQFFAPDSEPVKAMQLVAPVRIIPVSGQSGVYTFDFGQNLAGWGRLTVTGPAGTSVKMVFGEKTNSDGTLDLSNINQDVYSQQQYFQSDTYILKGGGVEVYEPRFTYHGFQYAQVTGLPFVPTTNTLVARVVGTALEPAGIFQCSSDLLNRIENITLWSYRANFVGIPTDCPQREKNGWTGDAQLASEMGLTHFHGEAAYARWIKEFRPAQLANGKLAGVFPNAIWSYNSLDGPAWESAMMLVPWFVYQHCGDARILTNNYAGMKAYVDYCTSVASGNIVSYGLGDWEPSGTVAPTGVTDTGYYYQDALIVAQTAAMLGNTADALQYSNLAAQIKVSFNNTYFATNTSQYGGGSETAQSCALYQGLVPTNQIPAVATALAATVQQSGNTMDTGILGSKYLLRALCDSGHSDAALALAMQTNYPSWGYLITKGATTLWETWNGSGSGDSLNHIMFGDISAWFMEYLGGIRPGTPGYKLVVIKPEIVNGLAWVQASHESPYGTISSAWQFSGQSATLNVTIPAGSTGVVYLPTMGTPAGNLVIQETGTTLWQSGGVVGSTVGVAYNHSEGSGAQTYSVWAVSSGTYQFTWNVSPAPNGLTAQAGNRWVTLSWTTVPGATGYNVKRSTTPGGPYTTLANVTVGSDYVDSTASNGTVWYYVVSATTVGGETVNSSEVSAAPAQLLNKGFETPRIGGFEYTPSGASWTFSGTTGNGSGITANGSGFTSSNPSTLEGTQVGFVQSFGSISQTLFGFSPGTTYTVTFSAAERAGANQHGGESWNLKIDNTVIASYNPGPSATSYVDYTATFIATYATHTLSFVGTDLIGGDNTVFIDNVRLSPSITPFPSAVTLASPANGAGFTSPATVNLAATVTTNGNAINSVRFFSNGTNLLAQLFSPPYNYAWSNVMAGNYSLRARVTFDGSDFVDSATVNVVVTNLPPAIQTLGLASGNFYLGGTGQSGQSFVLSSTQSLNPPVTWNPLLTNYSDSNGMFAFTNLPCTNQQQFFRVSTP